MAIPKKITPDHLKETIVEVRFASGAPLDLFAGVALSLLKPLGYAYNPVPNSNTGFFIKDCIRVQFAGNVINFNCFEDQYVGWDSYFLSIKEVVETFVSNNFIKSFDRVSIRYISEFENTELFSNIKGCFNIDADTGFTLQDSIVRLTKDSGKAKVFMTLTNKTKVQKNNRFIDVSLFDINAFVTLPQGSGMKELEEGLQEAHKEQKEAFFNTITEEFKESLNAEY